MWMLDSNLTRTKCGKRLPRLASALKVGLLLIGPFLIGCALVLLGIGVYLFVAEPLRIPAKIIYGTGETNVVYLARPPETSLETNLVYLSPPTGTYLSDAVTNIGIWVNSKRFDSGAGAACYFLTSAWRLWLFGTLALVCAWALRRRSPNH